MFRYRAMAQFFTNQGCLGFSFFEVEGADAERAKTAAFIRAARLPWMGDIDTLRLTLVLIEGQG
jgi:hypothetical protein